MNPAELLAVLQEFCQDKLTLLVSHEEHARHVGNYDFNNAYQYVIAREEVHLCWLAAAIEDLGGTVPAPQAAEPRKTALAICADDAARLGAFAQKWRERVEGVSHARHRTMLRLILGESVEQQRMFELAAAGRLDLLGRHPADAGSRGSVLPTRWLE